MKAGSSWLGPVTVREETREGRSLSSPGEDAARRWLSLRQEGGPHRNLSMLAPPSLLPSRLQDSEGCFCCS